MLTQLDILVWKWDSISMDFVTHLPRSLRKHDSIWVIVDRLTKTAHFLPIDLRISMEKLVQIYISEIVRLHGVPSSIVSEKDPKFTFRFWQTLQEDLGTRFRLSSRGLAQNLRIRSFGQLDEILPLAEFTYNNTYQASIGMTPFEVLYGRKCRTPLCWFQDGENILIGPELIQQTNEKVKKIQERLKPSLSR